MPSSPAATSTASEIAIPSEPVGCDGLAPARLGGVAGRADHGRAPALHHRAPVRLLVVARADHVDHALEPEQAAGQRQRRAPLAGARLRREPPDAGLLVRVGLRDRAVRLVRARPARRPRTCSRCARAYRARARAGGRGRAASGRHSLYASRTGSGISTSGSAETSWPMISIGKIGVRSSGPAGCMVPGLSGGSGSPGRSGSRFTQWVGMRSSVSVNFVWSVTRRS